MRIHATTAAVLLLAGACRNDPDFQQRSAGAAAGLGRCTIEEPGTAPMEGQSVFYVDGTPTAGGGTVGRFAVMLTCLTPGPAGTALTLVLPNLPDSLPRPARYRVLKPGSPVPLGGVSRLGWADAQVPATGGVSYHARGGEIVVEPDSRGGLVGSYLVALEREPEARGAPDRLVLGGAFAAPRNQLRRDKALPPAGR